MCSKHASLRSIFLFDNYFTSTFSDWVNVAIVIEFLLFDVEFYSNACVCFYSNIKILGKCVLVLIYDYADLV